MRVFLTKMRIYNVLYLYSKFILTFMIVRVYGLPSGGYVDSPCDQGVCKLALECPEARKAINEHKYHNLERCGFKGFDEIVCCPNPNRNHRNSSNDEDVTVWTDEPNNETTEETTKPEVRGPKITRKCVQACVKFSTDVEISLSFHIVDGQDAKEGEFPHMVALGYKSIDKSNEIEFNCGGTLISYRYVLTAAHCIINADENPPILVRLGHIDIPASTNELTSDDYNITNITVHRQYNYREKHNDVALLKLTKKVVPSNNVHPACLYTENNDPLGLVVTGWGTTTLGGDRSAVMQKAKLRPVPLTECNNTFVTSTIQRRLVDTQMCAQDDTSDACQGDSGGPLQIQNANGSSIYSVVGITSYGIGCSSRYPGIYTRVYSFLDWIETIVWPD